MTLLAFDAMRNGQRSGTDINVWIYLSFLAPVFLSFIAYAVLLAVAWPKPRRIR